MLRKLRITMREEVKIWWELALDDIDTSKKNFVIQKYHVTSLYAQQATEKALKALYIQRFNELKKTHDLVFLANKLNTPEQYKTICKQLEPVYLETRYPDVSGKLPKMLFDKSDAAQFLKIAEEVLQWVKTQLS